MESGDGGGNADGVALVVASSAVLDASKEQLKQDVDGGTADVDDTGVISVDAEDQDADKPEAAEESSQHALIAANEKRARLRQALVQLVACLCSVGSGAVLAVSGAILGRFAVSLDSPLGSAFYSFLVGTAILAVAFWIGPRPRIKETLQSKASSLPPWYLWIGSGALGALYVISASYVGPRLGFGFYFVVVITGQLSSSLLLDHIEFLHATPRKEITVARLVGCLLAVAGATITCIERITSYVDANGGFDTIWVLYIAWALASGAVLPVQVCTLAAFTKRMQTRPWRTTFLSFFTGTILLGVTWGIVILAQSEWPDYSRTEWWEFMVGFLGVIYVFSATVIPPVLGVAVFLVCVMAGQLVTSLILDSVGAFGFPVVAATALRIAGVCVAYLGAVTVQFGDPAQAMAVRKWQRRKG